MASPFRRYVAGSGLSLPSGVTNESRHHLDNWRATILGEAPMQRLLRGISTIGLLVAMSSALASTAQAACEEIAPGIVRCQICGEQTCCVAYYGDCCEPQQTICWDIST